MPKKKVAKKRIRESKDHIRTVKTDVKSLKKSIKKEGLIEQIVVNKQGVIISGSRRARALGDKIKDSDIRIVDVSTKDILRKQLVMELNKEDLNPMDLAYGLDKYKKKTRLSGRKCAKDLGVSHSYFRRMRKLVDLPADLKAKIRSGEVAPNSYLVREAFKKKSSDIDKWRDFERKRQYQSLINSISRMRYRIETSSLTYSDMDDIASRLQSLAAWVKVISKSRCENGK